MVYLSLITEKKNLLQLIHVVVSSKASVTLDVYGPVKDEGYWEECKKLMQKSDGRIVYRGDVKPQNVQSLLEGYHAMAIFTKGENFGHALYESLSVGRPLITSFFTPWNDLKEKKAGWNVDISDRHQCQETLEAIAEMDEEAFSVYCIGAYALAKQYYENLNAREKYERLFAVS